MSLLNVLTSHAYIDKIWERVIKTQPEQARFLIDSGAFTNFTMQQRTDGTSIFRPEALNDDGSLNLDYYLARLDRLGDAVWQYIMLDVPLNRSATEANLAEMVRRGYAPMPVLTTDAPLELIPEYVKINPHICIAGGVTQELNYYTARLEKAYRISNGQARLHGLGFTRQATVRSRVWSVDSSSWLAASRFGNVAYFDKVRGGMRTMRFDSKKDRLKIVQLVARAQMGKDFGGLHRKKGSFSVINVLTVSAWLDYATYARKHGLEFFFAVASARDLLVLTSVAAHRDPESGRIDAKALSKICNSVKQVGTYDSIMRNFDKELRF